MRFATELVMEASPKMVVVVENDPSVRTPLVKNLKQHGFHASGAANRREMLALVRELKQEIDVAILDVNLEGKDSPATTGLDIGQEMVEAQPDLPPQRIVYSGHDDQEYYRAAVLMGADDYIAKSAPGGQRILVNRVHTSSLVRALSPVRAEISEKLGQIAEKELDTLTAVGHICRQVIAPEVEVCLGVPSVFLLSDAKSTRILAPEAGQPEGDATLAAQIQSQVFDGRDGSDPFVFTPDAVGAPADEASRDFLGRLEGSSFIPLYDDADMRLSIGLLAAEPTDPLRHEKDPREFAAFLHPKLREPVVKQLKYLSRVKETIEKTKLKHTSTFCLYVSKTQMNVLEESLERKEIESENRCFRKLKRLADDLYATGIEFSQLNEAPRRARPVAPPEQKVSARAVVDQAWEMLRAQGFARELDLKQTGADFELRIARKDLLVAVLRMLQWLAQRGDKVPPEAGGRAITVAYERHGERTAIRFTDRSRRLGEQLRRKLFEPFTQSTTTTGDVENEGEQLPGLYLPLYLAKTLVAVKNGGSLEDRTADLPGDLGHCFLMSFPAEKEEPPDEDNG
jgi:DNA-binding NarL/FixJ family response regulator